MACLDRNRNLLKHLPEELLEMLGEQGIAWDQNKVVLVRSLLLAFHPMRVYLDEYIHHRYAEHHEQIPASKKLLRFFVSKVRNHVPIRYLSSHNDLRMIRKLLLKQKVLIPEEMELLDLFFPADLGPLAANAFLEMIPPEDIFEDAVDTTEIPDSVAQWEELNDKQETSDLVEPATLLTTKQRVEPVPLGPIQVQGITGIAPAE
jgi:hypothetical protein